LNTTAEIDLEAQPADETDRLSELYVQPKVAHHLEHHAVGVAQGEVAVAERGGVLLRRVVAELKGREELRALTRVDPVPDAGGERELMGAREVGLEADAR
jgi:hypothetical protein